MEELESILKNYLDKGSDRIDVTAVLSLIKIIREEQEKQLTLTNVGVSSEQLKDFVEEFIESWEDGSAGDTELYRKAKNL